MDLPAQWPYGIRADAEVVEVVDQRQRRFDLASLAPLGDAPRADGALALADGASLDVRGAGSGPLRARRELRWRDRVVKNVLSVARSDGWYALDAEGLVRVADGRRWPVEGGRLLAPAGAELYLLSEGRLARWAEGRVACELELDGRAVAGMSADTSGAILFGREGLLLVDRDCRVGAALAGASPRALRVGERLLVAEGPRLVALSLPEFGETTPPRAPVFKAGELRVDLADGVVRVQGSRRWTYTIPGLTGLAAVAVAEGRVAVTDGRVVAVLGGPRWLADGVVSALTAVGAEGVEVELRGPDGGARRQRLGGPSSPALAGVAAGVTAGSWDLPELRVETPAALAPLAPLRCAEPTVEIDGARLPWSFTRPTLVAAKLPPVLPTGADALTATASPSSDLHAVGVAPGAALEAACNRPLGAEGWAIGPGGVGEAWPSVTDALGALEAEAEGYGRLRIATPTGAWRVPTGGEPVATAEGLLLRTASGSVLFDPDGPRLRLPGRVTDGGTTWIGQAGPLSYVVDRGGGTVVEVVAGELVAADDEGVVRRVGAAWERLGVDRERRWGPRREGATVAGWRCARDPRSGDFEPCIKEEEDHPFQGQHWTLRDKRFSIRAGPLELMFRVGIQAVVPGVQRLYVRAHAADRPWIAFDALGRPQARLPAGELVVAAGRAWLLRGDRLEVY